jgi:hypothetical protein
LKNSSKSTSTYEEKEKVQNLPKQEMKPKDTKNKPKNQQKFKNNTIAYQQSMMNYN